MNAPALHVLIFDAQSLAGTIRYMHLWLSDETSLSQYFPKSKAADLPKAWKLRVDHILFSELLAKIVANTTMRP